MSQDEYARRAARVAAAQLAEAAGFDRVQTSSLDILSDLLLRYISEVGAASHAYAELANRTEANPLDVVQALQDVGVTLPELRAFAAKQAGIPFAQTIAPFPQARTPAPPPTFAERSEAPPRHIPDFLPALPDLHSYTATERLPQSERSAVERQLRLAQQQKSGEKALVKLQARLAPTNALLAEAAREQPPAAPAEDGAGAQDALATAEDNPFLAAAVWGEGAVGTEEASAGAEAAVGGTASSAPRADAWPAVEKAHWTSLADASTGQPAPKPFAAWQWTGQQASAARVATSGRSHQEDAYGAREGELGRQGRKRGVAESDRNAVEAILAAAGVEAEAEGYGGAANVEDMELDREQI